MKSQFTLVEINNLLSKILGYIVDSFHFKKKNMLKILKEHKIFIMIFCKN